MRYPTRQTTVFILLLTVLTGCVSNPDKPNESAKPASSTADSAKSKTSPGVNEKGEVIDSTKIESGTGRKVKGIADTEGEIFGSPAPGSKFARLQIGMSQTAVTELIGRPSDRGVYMTGKGFIPFYMGGDRRRHEWVYKDNGRLVFTAGGGVGDMTGRLIMIVHNRNEPAYR